MEYGSERNGTEYGTLFIYWNSVVMLGNAKISLTGLVGYDETFMYINKRFETCDEAVRYIILRNKKLENILPLPSKLGFKNRP